MEGQNITNGAKKEALSVAALFAASLALFKIIFYSESIIVVLMVIISLFWLFVIPGYVMMLYWHGKISFAERLAAGIMLSASIMGIASYYVGIAGLNIIYHSILLPLAMIGIGATLLAFKR